MAHTYRINCDAGSLEVSAQTAALRHSYHPWWIDATADAALTAVEKLCGLLLQPNQAAIAAVTIAAAKPYVKRFSRRWRRTRTR
jgi:hypothetical protein